MNYLVLALALSSAYAEDPQAATVPVTEPVVMAPLVPAPDVKVDAAVLVTPVTDVAAAAVPVPVVPPVTAPVTPEVPPADVVAEATALSQAIQSKNWPLAVGFGLSILVALGGKFGLKDKIGANALPWVATALAVAGTVGAALIAGTPVVDAGVQGLLAGVAAIGGWELFLKHFIPAKKPVTPEVPSPVVTPAPEVAPVEPPATPPVA